MVLRFRNATVIAVQVAFVALFLLGYSARYVSPRYAWGLQLIAAALPLLSLILIVLAVGAFVWGSGRLQALYVALGLLIIVRFFTPGTLFRQESGQADPLVVLTFNTHNARYAYGDGTFSTNEVADAFASFRRALLPLVRSEQPHLLSLQEAQITFADSSVDAGRTAPHIMGLVDTLGFSAGLIPGSPEARHDQVVMGRIPLIRTERIPLPVDSFGAEGQPVIKTTFLWQGRECVLLNVRFHSITYKPWQIGRENGGPEGAARGMLVRYRNDILAQVDELNELMRIIAGEDRPVIIAGDFNTTPHNWIYREMTARLNDAFAQAGKGRGATYHARFPLIRIDYIFADDSWEVGAARTAQSDVSDHLPVVASLRLR